MERVNLYAASIQIRRKNTSIYIYSSKTYEEPKKRDCIGSNNFILVNRVRVQKERERMKAVGETTGTTSNSVPRIFREHVVYDRTWRSVHIPKGVNTDAFVDFDSPEFVLDRWIGAFVRVQGDKDDDSSERSIRAGQVVDVRRSATKEYSFKVVDLLSETNSDPCWMPMSSCVAYKDAYSLCEEFGWRVLEHEAEEEVGTRPSRPFRKGDVCGVVILPGSRFAGKYVDCTILRGPKPNGTYDIHVYVSLL